MAVLACLLAVPARAAQPEASPAVAPATEAHGSDLVGMIARAVNFAIFAGTLLYFLHSPIRT